MPTVRGNSDGRFMLDRRYPYYDHVEHALSDDERSIVREVCRRCSISVAYDHRRKGVLFYKGSDLSRTVLFVDRPELKSVDRIVDKCWRQINQTWIDIDKALAAGKRLDKQKADEETSRMVRDGETELKANVKYRMNKAKHGKHSRNSVLVSGSANNKAKESK